MCVYPPVFHKTSNTFQYLYWHKTKALTRYFGKVEKKILILGMHPNNFHTLAHYFKTNSNKFMQASPLKKHIQVLDPPDPYRDECLLKTKSSTRIRTQESGEKSRKI